jgi:hypothetical protein
VIYDDGDGSQGGNGGNDSESNSVKEITMNNNHRFMILGRVIPGCLGLLGLFGLYNYFTIVKYMDQMQGVVAHGPFTPHNQELAWGHILGMAGDGLISVFVDVLLILAFFAVIYAITATIRSAWKGR